MIHNSLFMPLSRITALILFCTMSFTVFAQSGFFPPVTPAIPVTDTLHGTVITDNYQWLEDKNDPRVKEWSRAQHRATLDYLSRFDDTIDGLEEEIRAYIDRDIQGAIFMVKDKQFFYMRKQGEMQNKLYTLTSQGDRVIFDPVALDPSGMSSIMRVAFSHDASMVAVGLQTRGAEIATFYIVDAETGNQLHQPIKNLRGFSWARDGKHAYITPGSIEQLEQQKPLRTYLHKLDTDHSSDQFLIAPDDAMRFASVWDAEYSTVTFTSDGDFYSNTLSLRAGGALDKPVELYSSNSYRAFPVAIDHEIYFLTNHEAPNFRVKKATLDNPQFEHWTDLIPEQEDIVIQSFAVTDQFLVLRVRHEVLSRLHLHDKNGKFLQELALPETGSVAGMSYHRESGMLYVNISSFTSPGRVYKLDLSTLEWTLHFEQETPADTENITSSLIHYKSKDGTRVPMFLVHRKDLELNNDNPVWLYGYGGFNVGISPSFIGMRSSFINRGGVYAVAGLRGGDEYGESWHHDGMLFKKQNTFDDFIAAAEYLIDEGYTSAQRMAIHGGSNGGLLIGAVLNQRPDLFKAAICAVPLLDMVRYHKFLIARFWIPEYGDPDVEADFRNILQYSPYHNIRKGVNLPVTMITAGENDTRVDPLHAKKHAAALQNNPGQKDPILLYMDFDSGHGTGKSTEQIIQDQLIQFRFIMNHLGMQ